MLGNIQANAGASANIQDGIVWSADSYLLWPPHNVAGGWVLKGGQYNTYSTTGTSAAHPATLMTAAGSTTNACLTGASANNQSTFNVSYLNFTRLGSSSVKAMTSLASNVTTSGSTTNSIQNCTFDTCGEIDFGTTPSTNTNVVLTFSGNTLQNSLKNGILAFSYNGVVGAVTPPVITNNVFAESPGAITGATFSPPGNATVTGNYFGGGVSHGGTAVGDSPDKAAGAWSNNIFRQTGTGQGATTSLDHCYLLNDSDTQNSAIIAPWRAYGGSRTMDSCIVEVTYSQGVNTVGDMIQPTVNGTKAAVTGAANNGSGLVQITATAHGYSNGDTIHIGYVTGTTEANGVWVAANVTTNTFDLTGSTFSNAWISGGNCCRFNTTLTIQNTISVPGGPARAGSKWVSVIDQGFSLPIQVAINHCTWATANYGTQSETGIGTGENNDTHTSGYGWAGEVTSLKSNIAYSPDAAHKGYLMVRQQSTMKDYAQAANCDYNCGYQLDTDGGTSAVLGYYRWTTYQTTPFFSSGSPDPHGCVGNSNFTQNPMFVDSSRCMALYDNASTGLNNATATTWVTSTVYAIGDFTSTAIAGYYGGATINYRCISLVTQAERAPSQAQEPHGEPIGNSRAYPASARPSSTMGPASHSTL